MGKLDGFPLGASRNRSCNSLLTNIVGSTNVIGPVSRVSIE